MTMPPVAQPDPPSDAGDPADPVGASVAPRLPSLGALLSAGGFALVAVSTALAWANQPFPGGPPVYPLEVPLPNIISATAEGLQPTLALTMVTLAVIGLAFSLLDWSQTWARIMQTVLVVLVGTIVVLFALRWNSFFTSDLPVTFFGSLQRGFYLVSVGTLLAFAGTIVGLLSGRQSRQPDLDTTA